MAGRGKATGGHRGRLHSSREGVFCWVRGGGTEGGGRRTKTRESSSFLRLSLDFFDFLLFSPNSLDPPRPLLTAGLNRSLRRAPVIPRAGGLFCVLTVSYGQFTPAAFRQAAAAAQRSGDRPGLYGHGERVGGGKTASPFSRSGRIVLPHPLRRFTNHAPTSRGSGKTGHGLSRAVP